MVGVRGIWIFIFIAHISASAFADLREANPLIRVRLKSSIERFEIEGSGIQLQGKQLGYELVAIPQRQRFSIIKESHQGKHFWKITGPRISSVIAEPILAIKARDLRANGKSLPEQIFLSSRKEKFDVIGVLPLESYLVGVIASEMPLSWPQETLKAQAIAARSYAMSALRERKNQAFHVESTVLDQVFNHLAQFDDSPLIKKARIAVKETEGLYLQSENLKVLKAYYHSDCGGKTADARSVWGAGISTGSALDHSCPGNPKAQWQFKVEENDLNQALRSLVKKSNLGSLLEISLVRPSLVDRVEKLALQFEFGAKVVIGAQDFRRILGYDRLKSTMFNFKKVGSVYQFDGQGFGHGVGLCQWGARALGAEGRSYQEILKHYYPKAILSRKSQELEYQKR